MTIGIFKEWLVKYFFVHKIVLKAILVFLYTLDYLATFAVSKMASYVFVNRQTSGESASLPQYEGTELRRVMFSYEVKTGPIYGMETNIKSGNGWF
jgi:type IV secretory pathway VirB3-like protein